MSKIENPFVYRENYLQICGRIRYLAKEPGGLTNIVTIHSNILTERYPLDNIKN